MSVDLRILRAYIRPVLPTRKYKFYVTSFTSPNFASRTGVITDPHAYDETFTYDANGNLKFLKCYDGTGTLKNDFTYLYSGGSNRLISTRPVTNDLTVNSGSITTSSSNYRNITVNGSATIPGGANVTLEALESIILGPNAIVSNGATFNAKMMTALEYDAIGNLVRNAEDNVTVKWTPNGKVREVNVSGGTSITTFRYNAMGNRVEKKVVANSTTVITRYVHDASGNVMTVYNDTTMIEQPIYGSSRVGQYIGGSEDGKSILGLRQYEVTNHLGNVLSVVNDKVTASSNLMTATVLSTTDYYAFGSDMPGRTWKDPLLTYRYGFNGKEKADDIYGSGNWYSFEFREYDARIGRFITIDPIANNYPFQSPYVFAGNNPVAFIDILGMGPGDPKTHKVVKGDNLTKISKKYGASIDDLVKMNGIEDANKISIGQELIVNPEANFSKNPRGGYQNPDNPDGPEIDVDNIAEIGFDFVLGKGNENTIVVGGGALQSVQDWNVVKTLVQSGLEEISSDGKWVPGEVAYRQFRPGNLPTNIKKGLTEAWEKIKNGEDPWMDNSQNTPIHVLGSFNLSVRVNANGTTATVCIYDSKTFRSFSDGNASDKANRSRKDSEEKYLTNTYQRYLWNVNIQE